MTSPRSSLPNLIEWRNLPPPDDWHTYLFALKYEHSEVIVRHGSWDGHRVDGYPAADVLGWAEMPTRAIEKLLRKAYRNGYADGTAACDDDGIGTWPEPEQIEAAMADLESPAIQPGLTEEKKECRKKAD